jgi:hypothetical protein
MPEAIAPSTREISDLRPSWISHYQVLKSPQEVDSFLQSGKFLGSIADGSPILANFACAMGASNINFSSFEWLAKQTNSRKDVYILGVDPEIANAMNRLSTTSKSAQQELESTFGDPSWPAGSNKKPVLLPLLSSDKILKRSLTNKVDQALILSPGSETPHELCLLLSDAFTTIKKETGNLTAVLDPLTISNLRGDQFSIQLIIDRFISNCTFEDQIPQISLSEKPYNPRNFTTTSATTMLTQDYYDKEYPPTHWIDPLFPQQELIVIEATKHKRRFLF